jgi:hypothetical protein
VQAGQAGAREEAWQPAPHPWAPTHTRLASTLAPTHPRYNVQLGARKFLLQQNWVNAAVSERGGPLLLWRREVAARLARGSGRKRLGAAGVLPCHSRAPRAARPPAAPPSPTRRAAAAA